MKIVSFFKIKEFILNAWVYNNFLLEKKNHKKKDWKKKQEEIVILILKSGLISKIGFKTIMKFLLQHSP